MRRAWAVAAGVLLAITAAVGLGSLPSAVASQTTKSTTYKGTTISWLSSTAAPWNDRLNNDQVAVDKTSGTTSKVTGSIFFARLSAACTELLRDAGKAGKIPHAPSTTVEKAWEGMVVRTKTYASDCVKLTRTHSNLDLTAWNNSLKAMDTANATLNSAVDAARTVGSQPAG